MAIAELGLDIVSERAHAADALVIRGLEISKNKYGPNHLVGGEFLAYHGPEHTQDVISAVTKIGMLGIERGKIDFATVDLLRVAAAFHDTVQLHKKSGENEMLSAYLADTLMNDEQVFSRAERDRVISYILATQVYTADGTIEQRPDPDYATQIMCDADLALLGANDERYFARSSDLFKEIKRGSEITPLDVEDFLRNQRALLMRHRFFTQEAREIFPRQKEHLKQTNVLLNDPVEFSKYFIKHFLDL